VGKRESCSPGGIRNNAFHDKSRQQHESKNKWYTVADRGAIAGNVWEIYSGENDNEGRSHEDRRAAPTRTVIIYPPLFPIYHCCGLFGFRYICRRRRTNVSLVRRGKQAALIFNRNNKRTILWGLSQRRCLTLTLGSIESPRLSITSKRKPRWLPSSNRPIEITIFSRNSNSSVFLSHFFEEYYSRTEKTILLRDLKFCWIQIRKFCWIIEIILLEP